MDDDAFVIRYDTFGNQIWLRQFGSTAAASDVATGVAADATGVYVVGMVSGALPGQMNSGGTDVFVRKYNVNGDVSWTRQFGTPSTDQAYGIAADDSGVYVTGRTNGDLAGPHTTFDIFLRKYDTSGTEVWTRQFGTDSVDQGNAVAVDASGVYVAGDTRGVFAGQEKIGGLWDEFLAKFDFDGQQQWVRQFGTHYEDSASGVAVNFDGVFVVGYNDGEALPDETALGGWDAFVRIYDVNGNETATRQFGTTLNDWAYRVAADDSGAYICGYFRGLAEGQTPLGQSDAFLLKIPGQPALSFAQFVTDGTEATIKSGIIALQSNRGTDSRVEGTEAFELLSNFVSVPSSPARSSGQLYASRNGTEDTGVALYNPSKQNTITLQASLFDNTSLSVSETDITVEPGKQVVAFIDDPELFGEFFSSLQGDFQGRLRLVAVGEREFALLGLLQKKANGRWWPYPPKRRGRIRVASSLPSSPTVSFKLNSSRSSTGPGSF